MKEKLVLCEILMKRLLRRKSFLVLLCLMPLAVAGMQGLARSGETSLRVAVYAPDRDKWEEALCEDAGYVRIYFCDTPEKLKEDVITGKAECGYILPENLMQRFGEDDWYWAVEAYESSNSIATDVVNETMFSRIFQVVSSEWFTGYILDRMGPEVSAEMREQEFVLAVLLQKLEDGSTFSVETRYIGHDEAKRTEDKPNESTKDGAGIAEKTETAESGEKNPAGGIFPARGAAAALIYACALMGAMDALRDRHKGFFIGRSPVAPAVLAVGLPVCLGTCAGYAALLAAGACRGIRREFLYLLVYALLLTGYGCVLQWILRRESILAGCIPFLFLACLVCAPVFIDLSSIVPVMRILEKCFPTSFYLRGF
ncbi:MAG: hypothetical protein HDR26_09420 [Lachnospiraceae bacterium]|nr:hypothetical protein [Lachnospiraceae bacterium]